MPQNGFPALSAKASDLAWPGRASLSYSTSHLRGGKQPYSLECWPKRWDGAPLACTEAPPCFAGFASRQVSVLDDTTNGWPGKCRGLVEIKGVNGTDCGRNCRENPSCPSWQNTVYYSCWQGLGKERRPSRDDTVYTVYI